MKLLLYGLQRSGTNYLEQTLKRNFRVVFLNSDKDRKQPCQKHFRIYDNKEVVGHIAYKNNIHIGSIDELEQHLKKKPDAYLIVSKDPYSWCLSYQNWAAECKWPPVSHHYVEEYNLFYGKWVELANESERIHFVKYIDLLDNTKPELNKMAKTIHLKPKLFSNLRPHRISTIPQSERFSKDRLAYYTQEKYLSNYTPDQLEEINKYLDTNVMSSLGYQIKHVQSTG